MNLLPIPHNVLNQHAVALGKTGAGKSSALRVCVEHLLDDGKRAVIIDPKGDWWGLGAEGTGPGHPVVLLGDFKKADVDRIPLTKHAGKEIARVVLTSTQTFIIGMRGWSQGAMTRFWIDFASTLFNEAHGQLHIVVDEIHNFAPKGRVMSPESGECLHWTNRLMSEGRGLGLTFLIASQRPQKVHNDTLTCCETLIALRVIHAADRQAVKDWIDGCGDVLAGRGMVGSLADLNRGEAYVWCPEEKFGPTKVQFPLFRTYDSFAPPEKQAKRIRRREMPLDELKAKLAKVVHEAEENDPAALRAEILRLTQENKAIGQGGPSQVDIEDALEKAAQDGQKWGYERCKRETLEIVSAAKQFCESVKSLASLDWIEKGIKKVESMEWDHNQTAPEGPPKRVFIAPQHKAEVQRVVDNIRNAESNGITKPQQAILDTCAMLLKRGYEPNSDMVARWLDLHPRGGGFRGNLADLRSAGYLDGFTPTAKAKVKIEPTGFDGMVARLAKGTQLRIVTFLRDTSISDPKRTFTAETLAGALELHHRGGGFRGDLARLRTMEIITPKGNIGLNPEVFR